MPTADILEVAAFARETAAWQLWLIALFPLLGAAINGIVGKPLQDRLGKRANHTIAIAAMLAAFGVTLLSLVQLMALPAGDRLLICELFPMIEVGELRVHFAFAMDPLSATMAMIITGIGTLIHVYSTGYMHDEPAYWRYFCYLNLFVFAMLLLVLGDSFVLMFFGWEGVGLCSYLLIGFWYTDVAKAAAGMKAFIVNRIGDVAFVTGLFLLFWSLSGTWNEAGDYRRQVADGPATEIEVLRVDPTMDDRAAALDAGAPVSIEVGATVSFRALERQLAFEEINTVTGETRRPLAEALVAKTVWGIPVVFLVCLLFFIGATGKSAQIPLYVWLPDAMAGPTPVSALIHAATMVTAGVYMVARLNFLYWLSPGAMTVVALVGALTALFAATMALVQYDIKKVLAYSTVSQLGFMFVGVGVGAWWVGVFHLLTHACFKACLFLGSGSVIHGMHFLQHGHGGADGDADADREAAGASRTHAELRAAPDPRDPQDMRNMGGLASIMPHTRKTYLIACWAIAGFPWAAGFYSKDEILWKAMSGDATLVAGWLIWALCFAAAGCTSFYMFRSYYMTFYRRPASPAIEAHCHESPRSMTHVLWVLAVLAVIVGPVLGLPHFLHLPHSITAVFEQWLAPVTAGAPFRAAAGALSSYALELALVAASIGIATAGWWLARSLYRNEAAAGARAAALAQRYAGVHRLLYNKYFVDELYDRTVVRGFVATARGLAWLDGRVIDAAVNLVGRAGRAAGWLGGAIDRVFVDGAVNGVARVLLWLGREGRRLQTGRINNYAFGIAVGVLTLAIISRFAL